MPLYNNILSSAKKADSAAEGISEQKRSVPSDDTSLKFLQQHLLSKRRLPSNKHVVSPNLKQSQSVEGPQNEIDPRLPSSGQVVIVSELHKTNPEHDWDPEDEYDPLAPNSYEIIMTEYMKAQEQRLAMNRSQQITMPTSAKKMNPILLDVVDKLDSNYDLNLGDIGEMTGKSGGVSIAPPFYMSSESLTSPTDNVMYPQPTILQGATIGHDKPDGASVAAKIMSKMGYKVGQGLGKDEQGISSPLEVEKSGSNIGRILTPAQRAAAIALGSSKNPNSSERVAELLRESTRILLLQNMVGPGEVDDDLEAETKEECKKYGDVIKCLIYEIPNKRVPDEESVRIFVEFRNVESAIKAASDLDGRYFGGRIVKASFYSVERFNKYELGP